ncbi:relaxase/mobilization nuclease domain-containing protein [Eubacteriales bacterium OttesenSCG-928-K08]|nr:relaxase/mobilization nuclease domain-containing protein [Eubacteriales bacterium OttesenSCG-928-K08]
MQSFKGQEASPELAHKIAKELAEKLIGDGFQAVVSTHLNTGNIHSHIVWNSVNCFTGAKYISNSKSYYLEVRRLSDELCKKYGLSIIDPEQDSKGKAYAEWQAEKNGEPTYRSIIRNAIDEAIRESFSFPQFTEIMEEKGFRFKLDLKRPSIRFQGRERYARFDRLGKGYDLEDIKERIAGQSLDSYEQHFAQEYSHPQRPPRKYSVFHKTTLRSAFSMRGLRGLYFHYLYRMGVLPNKSQYQRKPSAYLLDEIRQLDKRIAMYEYLCKHNISTTTELHAR